MPTVVLSAIAILAGLGGVLRNILVNESYVQACWPLSEKESQSFGAFRDISGAKRHLTLVGTGITRCVRVDIPEGAMGITLDGTTYLQRTPASSAEHTALSLSGGSMDVSFLMQTSTNDATLRAIIQKQETDSAGNGWHVALQSGQIRFFLRVSGTTIFNFARGAVADGALHDVHCYYDPVTGKARIHIDGALSGSEVSTTNTDPADTSANLRIGGFSNHSGSNGFIGTLCYGSIGREGSLTLGQRINATRSWTDITDDVIEVGGAERGIPESSITGKLAAAGLMTLTMNNSKANSAKTAGLYSRGHASCRTGFKLGMPISLRATYASSTKELWRGRMIDSEPAPGVKGPQITTVTCGDWFHAASKSRFTEAEAQVSQLSTKSLGILLDQAIYPPAGVSFQAGSQTLNYAIDAGQADREFLPSEFSRVLDSEFAYMFQKGDGTIVVETRFGRMGDTTLDATISAADIKAMRVSESHERIINEVHGTTYPPVVDPSATATLFNLIPSNSVATYPIQPEDYLELDAPYTDPSDRPSRIGGTAIFTPVPTTDYTANTLSNGTGVNMTASLEVTTILGGSVMRVRVRNTSTTTPVFLTKLQVRGKGIYRYTATPSVRSDGPSVREFGSSPLTLDAPYSNSASALLSTQKSILSIHAQPKTFVHEVLIPGNASATAMGHVLDREIGDRVNFTESQSGVSSSDHYYINSIKYTVTKKRHISATWTVAPAWPTTVALVSYAGPVSDTHDLDAGPLVLTVPGDYTVTFNRTGINLNVRGAAGGGGGGAGSSTNPFNHAGGGGGGGGAVNTTGVTVSLSTTEFSVKVGARGAGVGSGTAGSGGTTEFRVPSGTIHLQLPGGAGGTSAASAARGTGGAGGGVGTGSGNVAGTNGGQGGQSGAGGEIASNNATGAAGGGGGGDVGGGGGDGGDGKDQTGGNGGTTGNSGADASGEGGGRGNGGGGNGGGGGGGGGVLFNGDYYGGGGGGGGGDESSAGSGGDGGPGILVIERVV